MLCIYIRDKSEGEEVKSLIRLLDYSEKEILTIFRIADELKEGRYRDFLKNKTVIMFFPNSSIRTRVTFEKGVQQLGGQYILFPNETLDKKEAIQDVVGYLNNWVDLALVRHKNIKLLEEMAHYATFPIINGLTDVNHPCEMLTDLYALSKRRKDFRKDHYLFVGGDGNIGRAWKEAADAMGLVFKQCCPKGYEVPGVQVQYDLDEAIIGQDIICTDSISKVALEDFREYQVTLEHMKKANEGAILNPCPPFFRGEEVANEVIESSYFVGYEFKKALLEVQQAIMIYCMGER